MKIFSTSNSNVALKIIPGHFATSYSHVNFYIDLTTLKSRQSEAQDVAKVMAQQYVNNTIVDTIVCLEGCEVIGAYLAHELTKAGIISMNAHKTIYIISPEYNSNGQMIFQDNNKPAIYNKHIILIAPSITTGNTARKALDSIKYYGGKIQGVSGIFSVLDKLNDIRVNAVFKEKDLPEYSNYNVDECPFCEKEIPIEAIVSSKGYIQVTY